MSLGLNVRLPLAWSYPALHVFAAIRPAAASSIAAFFAPLVVFAEILSAFFPCLFLAMRVDDNCRPAPRDRPWNARFFALERRRPIISHNFRPRILTCNTIELSSVPATPVQNAYVGCRGSIEEQHLADMQAHIQRTKGQSICTYKWDETEEVFSKSFLMV